MKGDRVGSNVLTPIYEFAISAFAISVGQMNRRPFKPVLSAECQASGGRRDKTAFPPYVLRARNHFGSHKLFHRHFGWLAFQIMAYWFAIAVFSTAAAQSFVAEYGPTKSAQYETMQNQLRQGRFLEELADALSQNITLQDQLVLVTAECGTENAFYTAQHKAIVLCLDLITQVTKGIYRDFAKISTHEEVKQAISGAIVFILMHELGHALIDRLQLPVLGREEDAADQIGAFFLLHDHRAQHTLPGALWFFRSKTLFYTRRHFSDEHSVGPQRQSNLACWAYGKDHSLFNHLLRGGYLTKERAARCSKEYELLDSSVRRLLDSKVQLPPL